MQLHINRYYCYSLRLPCLGQTRGSCKAPCLHHNYSSAIFLSYSRLSALFYTHTLTHDLQEVDAAGARRWGDPDKAKAGGRLVADVGSDHTANKLGSTELPLWHHTWGREEKRMRPKRMIERNRENCLVSLICNVLYHLINEILPNIFF